MSAKDDVDQSNSGEADGVEMTEAGAGPVVATEPGPAASQQQKSSKQEKEEESSVDKTTDKTTAIELGDDGETTVVVASATTEEGEDDEEEAKKCNICQREALCPMSCAKPKCRKHLTSALLLLLSFFLFADQQLVAPNLSAIAKDLGLETDEERDFWLGGMVPVFFFALGAPITIFIGPIIDRVHRRNLFVILIFLGEIPCMCTWWVTEVWQLLLTRAITGISMAGAEPLIFSMLSDMYGVKERNIMASVITIGQGAGLLGGQALAGFLGPVTNWRMPFLFVSVPSMAFALLLLFIVDEPVRGAGEEAVREASEKAHEKDENAKDVVYKSNFTCAKVGDIFRVPTNIMLYVAEIPSAMGWGVLFAFLTDFVAIDKFFGVTNATTCVTILGVGLALGAVGGGILGQHPNNTCLSFRGAVSVLVGTAALLGPLPYYYVIYADFRCELNEELCLENSEVNATCESDASSCVYSPEEFYNQSIETCTEEATNTECPAETWGLLIFLLFLSGINLGTPTANARAMLLNVNLPETRGTSVTLLVVLSNLGKGFGPLIAATMIREMDRVDAFTIIVIIFSCACIPYYSSAATYAKDILKQEELVKEQVRVRGLTEQNLLADRLEGGETGDGDADGTATTDVVLAEQAESDDSGEAGNVAASTSDVLESKEGPASLEGSAARTGNDATAESAVNEASPSDEASPAAGDSSENAESQK